MLSPLYAAVSVFAPGPPGGKREGVSVQLPAPWFKVPVQESPAPAWPSVTVTVPVGVPTPGATAATVKLTITGNPTIEGFGVLEIIVVSVFALVLVAVRAMLCVLPATSLVLSVMVRVAAAEPVVEGVKVTEMVQLLLAAKLARQVNMSANSEALVPLMPILLMVRGAVPVFESVTVCGALLDPKV